MNITKIDEPVSVAMVYDTKQAKVAPYAVWRAGRQYLVKKVGYHHTFREGRILFHIFSVVTDSSYLRLKLNSENLSWLLEEVSDGF